MKGALAALMLGTAALGTTWGEEEVSVVGEASRDSGYKPEAAAIQSLAVSAYDHGNPTIYEQLMLELINRARANPGAEASRLGINLNAGLPTGTISNTPKPPLAFEEALIAAARGHSQWMLDTDTFSHTGTNGTSSSQRVSAAGYPLSGSWGTGENIAWRGTTGTVNVENFTRGLHDDLFKSFSHRVNMMDARFDQIGLGVLQGLFLDKGTNWKALMGSQEYAFSGGSPSPEGPFVLGVAYKDTNGNNFYDPGEGLGGVTVTLIPGSTSTTTSASGGYAIPLGSTSGALALTFSGGAVTTATQVAGLAMPGINLKVDLVVAPPTPVAATPVINPNGGTFTRSVKVKLTSATSGATIRFTKDGSEPTSGSPKYKRAITLKATTTIKAKAFKTGFTESTTATAVFTKI